MLNRKDLEDRVRHYKTNQNGQIGVWFAIMALPLLAFTTLAMDYTFAEKERNKLSSALDDAALAAVIKQDITETEREAYAADYFKRNTGNRNDIDLTVIEASASRVELMARTQVPTSISSALGTKGFTVSEESVSELTKGDVICMLILDPESEGSLKITTGARLAAENCSVQVNSRHKRAAIVNHGAVASAKDFCVTGGAVGGYTPHVNTECTRVADPYAGLKTPKPGPCVNPDVLKLRLENYRAKVKPGLFLRPGTYCGGLKFTENIVTFYPGTYIIKDGPLIFDDYTQATAHGVTFILTGENSYLKKTAGSKVDIIAPSEGPYAGLGFFQDRLDTGHNSLNLPSATTEIVDGSGLKLTGTGYFPTQKIMITNGAFSNTKAPATSFIGYQMTIRDGAYLDIAADHQEAGLPPILPRSDEGARLSR